MEKFIISEISKHSPKNAAVSIIFFVLSAFGLYGGLLFTESLQFWLGLAIFSGFGAVYFLTSSMNLHRRMWLVLLFSFVISIGVVLAQYKIVAFLDREIVSDERTAFRLALSLSIIINIISQISLGGSKCAQEIISICLSIERGEILIQEGVTDYVAFLTAASLLIMCIWQI